MASQESKKQEDRYIFKRDYKSSIRLNYNHFLIKGIAGYLLHPKIPLSPASLRIADIGTGTGIWALELASSIPGTVQLDCFDIAADQYPPVQLCPPNVRFHAHNCFAEFPDQYKNSFDIVHVRFWICAVNDPDARPFLKNLLSLLKPGGFLQWVEPLPLSTTVISHTPGAPQTASDQAAVTWKKPKPDSAYSWIEGLPKLYEDEGMTDILQTKHDIPDYIRPLWAQSFLAGMDDLLPAMAATIHDERVENIKKMMDGLQNELKDGVVVDTPFQTVIGRKGLPDREV